MKISLAVFVVAVALFLGLYAIGVLIPLWAWLAILVTGAIAGMYFVATVMLWLIYAAGARLRSLTANHGARRA